MSPRTAALWQKILLAVASPIVFLALLEGLLVALGVRPVVERRDPFVGFAAELPLFVPELAADGREELVTAANKLALFNRQRFARDKAAGAYRIFCLGGSTTYGRPYDDPASFAGWLRELLPAADPGRAWEVVNAGGISYASYRVAAVMEELAGYSPDLFLVYTGHNEFLEERSYAALRELPGAVRWLSARAARTRTWAAMGWLLRRGDGRAGGGGDEREILPREIETKLDHAAGPELYARDDELADRVAEHYRVSLERMVAIARRAGAEIAFVTPAANLRQCAPFKSQHTDGLSEAQRRRSRRLLAEAIERLAAGSPLAALRALDQALAFDPRFAELHYRRGAALLALGRGPEARAAFERARDEDVCPLRAPGRLGRVLAEVAAGTDTPLVDLARRLEDDTRAAHGHAIPGDEHFLDHVHLTLQATRKLALMLIEAMAERGIVRLGPGWGPEAIAAASSRVAGRIDRAAEARALANLAWTLDWAGKDEESRRLALRALESGLEDPAILLIVARHAAFDGDLAAALGFARRAVRADPASGAAHYQLGMLLARQRRLEAAAGHFLLASAISPEDDKAHRQLGLVLAERGRFDVALASLERARRLNPRSPSIDDKIAQVRAALRRVGARTPVTRLEATEYPSGRLRTLGQHRAGGRRGPHGIWTEWYETGELKRVVDYVDGRPGGAGTSWDREGVPRSAPAAAAP